MTKNKTAKIIGSVIITLPIIIILYTLVSIGLQVQTNCKEAKSLYEGDCVESHLEYLNNEELTSKNWASFVWSLGQMSDKRSTQFLNESKDELPCNEENKEGCMHEVNKALKWSTTSRNIPKIAL